jgi:hypothetical protein
MALAPEQSRTGSKILRGRGRAKKSLDLIEAMYAITEAARPITGRGVGYKLFTAKPIALIPSMAKTEVTKVYRLLTIAREEGTIPPEWIVDEHGHREYAPTWANPEVYTRAVIQGYRRDYWTQQKVRIIVVSEKGTVRGLLLPVLHKYGVDFQPMGGFCSFNKAYDIAQDDDGRPLIVLYVGDWDPSGMWMSERDLPERIARYGGDHVTVKRISLVRGDLAGLPSFPASDKKKDTRYKWFVQNYGDRCWELDALDPNNLRATVETEILKHIEPIAWERCKISERAEQESLFTAVSSWAAIAGEATAS